MLATQLSLSYQAALELMVEHTALPSKNNPLINLPYYLSLLRHYSSARCLVSRANRMKDYYSRPLSTIGGITKRSEATPRLREFGHSNCRRFIKSSLPNIRPFSPSQAFHPSPIDPPSLSTLLPPETALDSIHRTSEGDCMLLHGHSADRCPSHHGGRNSKSHA